MIAQGKMLWTLGAVAAIYYVFFRSSPANAGELRQLDVSNSNPNTIPGVAGAPVLNQSTALAVDQTSLLNRLLAYFRGGSSTSSSTGAASSSGSSTTTAPGPAVPPNTSSHFFGDNQNNLNWEQDQRTLGAPFLNGLGYAQQQDSHVQGPLNTNASGGFGSGAYHMLTISDLF